MYDADLDLEDFFAERDNVAGVTELADFLDLDEDVVRRFARRNDLRRIGSTYCFTLDSAEALVEELEEDELDDDDEAVAEEEDED